MKRIRSRFLRLPLRKMRELHDDRDRNETEIERRRRRDWLRDRNDEDRPEWEQHEEMDR